MKYETTRRIDYRTVVVVCAGLLLSLPCLLYGFPFYADDSLSNTVLYQEFSKLVWSGDLYPRWLEKLNGGLGNPTAYYYPPLSYWLTSIFKPLFRDDPFGWRQMGLSASVAIIASGLAAYLWLKRVVDRSAALVGSLTYLILPYHVAVDVYIRGALAETWIFVWMPIVLLFMHDLIDRRRYAFPCLAIGYAALVLTHLPTTVIFSVIPLAYAFYHAPARRGTKLFLLTAAAMALGLGLSAIYLVPALWMQNFMFHTTQGIGGHYYFGNWFLFTNLGWSGRNSNYFFAAIGAMLLAIFATLVGIRQRNETSKAALFWAVTAVFSFAMMTPVSKFVWQVLPTLQKIQFPFRFNTVLSLAVAALSALAVSAFRRETKSIVFAVVGVLLGVSWGCVIANNAYFAYPVHYMDQALIDAANNRLQQRRDTNEFRPRWVVSIEQDELDALLQHIGQRDGELTKVNVEEGQGTTAVEKWTAREIILRADSPGGLTLKVPRFYFPGWCFQIDSGEVKATAPSKPGGLISLKVPQGQHRIELRFLKRSPEIAGQLISLVSLILLVSLFIRFLNSTSRTPW